MGAAKQRAITTRPRILIGNSAYLEQAGFHLGHREVVESFRRLDGPRPFLTPWASPRTVSPHRILTGHRGFVTAVAMGQVGGRAVVASGGDDGTVRLWDPKRPKAEPTVVRGHEGWPVIAISPGVSGSFAVAYGKGVDLITIPVSHLTL